MEKQIKEEFFKPSGPEKCKVVGCNNSVMKGDFGDPSLRNGYCQIHKIEGLVEEVDEK